jgi:xylulose-5-phosphate/fructose-6-phosphate phosphoketolase
VICVICELKKYDTYYSSPGCLLARGQLPLGRADLSARQSAAEKPLTLAHIKPRLLGHWGTTPGLNFIYVHLNRVIKAHDLNMIYITGPGHGGPALVANTYLEGTYSELYPNIAQDEEGMRRLFKQFSFPGRHSQPCRAGDARLDPRGRRTGYSLSHAFGAAFDNPDLIVACVVGDGEAETGPLATSWHSNKFLNPVHDGAVLPILHLNGYKIANPTVLARIGARRAGKLCAAMATRRISSRATTRKPCTRHGRPRSMSVMADIRASSAARAAMGSRARPRWPMIVLRSPKGWTGPKEVDGKPTEGTWRSHQVPISDMEQAGAHVQPAGRSGCELPPEELFDEDRQAASRTRRTGARPARAAWAPIRTPTAACCCATCACRISATTP